MERRLAAVLSVDVAGYTRLMEADEMGTHSAYKDARQQVVDPQIEAHHGRMVKSTGDGLLAEFHSVVDALGCAVKVQQQMSQRGAEVPADKRMQFRIGINLGDIMVEEDDIYGEGVNVAARLEQLAEPGGICVSETVFQHAHKKVDFGFEHLGHKHVKNIAEPVSVFRVHVAPSEFGEAPLPPALARPRRRYARFVAGGAVMAGLAVVYLVVNLFLPGFGPAPEGRPALPVSDDPSIAVLPFDNISDDPNQEFFADGMTDDIITDLSKISGLLVISRNSTFTYKGRSTRLQQVGQDLGVRYILEGSVRRDRDQVRINAQLYDAVSGTDLWAERFDAELTDIFGVQDRVTERIVQALAVQISQGERSRVKRRDTTNIAAYDAFQRGWQHLQRSTPADLSAALAEFKKAVEIDPDFSRAYAAIGHAYWKSWAWGWESSVGATWATAPKLAREMLAKAMENPSAIAHQLAADIAIYERTHEKALAEALLAIELDPNDPSNHIVMAEALIYAGRPADARSFVDKAIRLDPLNPAYAQFVLGMVHFGLDEYEPAIDSFRKALNANPEDFAPAAPLAAAYAHVGNDQEMRTAIRVYLKGWPEANITEFRTYWPYREAKDDDRLLDGLRKAGLPES